MRPLKRSPLQVQLLTGCLVLLGIVLLIAAVWQPKENEPHGWVAMNDQVEQALEPLAKQEQKDTAGSAGKRAPELKNEADNLINDGNHGDEVKKGPDGAVVEPGGSAGSNSSPEQAGTVSVSEAPPEGGKIDINRATAQELDALPGIGASKAQAIVADREKNGRFQASDDLLRVKGIGPKLLEKIKGAIVARP